MESHIDRILEGETGYEHTSLYFPEKSLSLTVYENEDTEGVFHVLSGNDREINGTVCTSDPRMNCDSVTLDKGKAEIHFCFRARGLEAGAVIKGDISLICEEGEFRLPFSVSVVMKYPDSSQGPVKNLFHFTNLARNYFKEAVNVFYSPEMINVFNSPDKRFRNLYKAFSVYPGSAVNVEEFLIAIHKKSPVIYTTETDEVNLLGIEDISGLKELRVRKSGWGYIKLSASAEGDFISLKQDVFREHDFNGDIVSLPYTINREALHAGKNYGLIILKTFNSEIKVPVFVDITTVSRMESNKAAVKRQKMVKELMECYIAFRLKRMDLATYCAKTAEMCNRMTEADERDILPRLVATHVYLLEKRERDAELMLSMIGNEALLGQIHYEAEGYIKYLEAMLKRERTHTRTKAEEVTVLLNDHPDSAFLMSLKFNLDEELEGNPDLRLEILERQFSLGVRSPFIYIEILAAMTERQGRNSNSGISEIYALYWGVKNDLYYESLISTLLSISYGLKGYSPILLHVLKSYYEKYRSPELLEAVCTTLIRERSSRKKRGDDFHWFEEGVRYGLKITRLYESYLNTLPEDYDELLPEPILMYFSIGAGVGNERMAFLYANLIKHKDTEIVSEILKSNEQRIAGFAVKEAENGRIGDNLKIIYEYVALLNIKEIQNRFMLAISPLLFRHEIFVYDPQVRMVVSVENGFNKEHFGNATGGRAVISFYGGDYDLILEYNDMRRSIARKGIQDRVLLNPSKFIKAIRYGIQKQVGQAFYVCGSGRHSVQVNQVNESSVRILASSHEIERSFRDECIFALIRYYSDNDRFDELDRIVEDLDVSEVSSMVRSELARLFVARGMLKEVYELIREYGSEGVDPGILVRLASRMISEGINTEDPCLLNISFEALKRGKYDEHILKYLSDEYRGTIKELRDIWKAAKSFGIDTVRIEERMLSQMLFSHSFAADRDDILISCIENGGREKVIAAFLDHIAHEYFVYDNIVDDRIFDLILRRYRRDGELSDISALALLGRYAEKEKDEKTLTFLSPLVKNLVGKGIIFDFFREYRDQVPEMALYHDKTFVEYRTGSEKRVLIHYCISDDEAEESEYTDENMDEMYQGIYTGDFVLFYGDRLQYFITEESEDNRNITESRVIERDITRSGRTESRYDMINDMLLSESVNDDPSLDDLMDQYIKLSGTVEELF
ncbi:MAG: DUF5717 family protein [Lachnospiraceae bacterium]|nr:DUF5717 family protein [Lachnospiraceae bacterium]